MRNLLTLGVVVVVVLTLQALTIDRPEGPEVSSGALTVILGFLLLASYLGGSAAKQAGIPRITGYILVGLLVGPGVLGILTADDVSALGPIDEIAISLIALTAGAELRLSELRKRGRSIGVIMATEMTTVFVVTFAAMFLMSSMLPLTSDMDMVGVLTVALIFGSIAIANSPSVAVALINENRSAGPVTSTVLGVTVLKDVAVIILFAVALSIAQAIQLGGGIQADFALSLGREIGGSLLVGAASGWVLSRYFLRHGTHPVLFVLATAFLNAQLAAFLHLEVLLLSLTAGFFVENASGAEGERLLDAVETNSLPFYALFFSLAGAKIELGTVASIGLFVLIFVVARGLAVFGGTWLGARLADSEPAVRSHAWTGLVSQAGVTLGMVVIASRAFPEWGPQLTTLFVAMVAIHELVGPILFQHGLNASGEVGLREARARSSGAAPVAAGATPSAYRATGKST